MTTINITADDFIPQDLMALDESFRCTLCGGHFHAAVSIADPECGHSFCSECIRNTFTAQMKSTQRQRKCPACRCPVVKEGIIIPNRALQEAVLAFQKTLDERRKQHQKQQRQSDKESPLATPSPAPPTRSVSTTRRRNGQESPTHPMEPAMGPSIFVDEPPVLTKKPKPIYANKNRKRLQEMCEKEGLPTKSSDSIQELKDRHEAFINLWNAETDAIHPRSARQLVEEIMNREQQRRKEQLFGSGQTDHVALHALLENGKSGNVAFEQRLNNNFAKMIREMKQRDLARKHKNNVTADQPTTDPEQSKELDDPPISTTSLPLDDDMETIKPSTYGHRSPQAMTTQAPHMYDLLDSSNHEWSTTETASLPPTTKDYYETKAESSVPAGHLDSYSEPSKRRLEQMRNLRPKRQKPSMVGPWNCERCTFYNETRTWVSALCEMCNMKRPS